MLAVCSGGMPIAALSQLIKDRNALLDDGRMVMQQLKDTTSIDTECEELLGEMEVVTELIKKCVSDNSTQALDQTDYISKYTGLVERYGFIVKYFLCAK